MIPLTRDEHPWKSSSYLCTKPFNGTGTEGRALICSTSTHLSDRVPTTRTKPPILYFTKPNLCGVLCNCVIYHDARERFSTPTPIHTHTSQPTAAAAAAGDDGNHASGKSDFHSCTTAWLGKPSHRIACCVLYVIRFTGREKQLKIRTCASVFEWLVLSRRVRARCRFAGGK